MEISKIKEKYERQFEGVKQSIIDYESSKNHELRIASRTLKAEAEELNIVIDALEKQIPMQACFEYDDEFTCPACGYDDDGYDVKTLKVCPECGQKLDWNGGE